jgi:hypothetical protein
VSEEKGVLLKKTNLKIISIFVCILFLGILIPTAVAEKQTAEKQTDDQIQPTDFIHRRLMVFGHISEFIILDNIIIGRANQLIYYGRGLLNLDRGIITDKPILLKMAKHCHIWTVQSDLIILGRCISLNYL